jgi:hypothetical protein
MTSRLQDNADPSEETGVADVRAVRAAIAAKYHGDLRQHVDETNRIVEALVTQLGLKEGLPTSRAERR